MRAYLTEGELMSDHATLERLGDEVGLPADEVRDMLATDRFAAEVRDDEHTATSLGISAVPFFVVDRRIGAAGAQPPRCSASCCAAPGPTAPPSRSSRAATPAASTAAERAAAQHAASAACHASRRDQCCALTSVSASSNVARYALKSTCRLTA